MPSVLIVRGHLVTPWELRPWNALPGRFDVSYLLTGSNQYAAPHELRSRKVRALRDALPRGPLGDLAAGVMGDRYLGAEEAFDEADIVHAEELSFWFAADAARRKPRHRYKLVQTIWETLPHMSTYRNRHARRYRRAVLDATDLFLPATERAAEALLLEGVPPERIVVCAPGIDLDRFGFVPAVQPPRDHTIVSPARLVWEKGHQDVVRAVAALHRGLVRLADGTIVTPRLHIVGYGPEEGRLRAHAAELGIAASVEIGGVPYEQMPEIFASASAMVLASQSAASAYYHLVDVPRAFWEEQFGLVLAEAMASGLSIVASRNGAIPEVLTGTPADLFEPGDWLGIARALAAGPLARAPGGRVHYPSELVERYSTGAAAERLADAYDRVLAA